MIFSCSLKKCWVSTSLLVAAVVSLPAWSLPGPAISLTAGGGTGKAVQKPAVSSSLAALRQLYKTQWKRADDFKRLAQQTWGLGSASTPLLLEVMKSPAFPDQNRWVATMSLGKVMGKNASKVLVRFLEHPYWMMKLAALKALTALKVKEPGAVANYEKLLKDNSLVVRSSAVQTMKLLELKQSASHLVTLLQDERNYTQQAGQRQSTDIIDQTVIILGQWKYDPAKELFKKLMLREDSMTLSYALDYSLEQMTGKNSPRGDLESKKNFWKQHK